MFLSMGFLMSTRTAPEEGPKKAATSMKGVRSTDFCMQVFSFLGLSIYISSQISFLHTQIHTHKHTQGIDVCPTWPASHCPVTITTSHSCLQLAIQVCKHVLHSSSCEHILVKHSFRHWKFAYGSGQRFEIGLKLFG